MSSDVSPFKPSRAVWNQLHCMQLEQDQPIIKIMSHWWHLILDHREVFQFTVQWCLHVLIDGIHLAINVVLFNYKENWLLTHKRLFRPFRSDLNSKITDLNSNITYRKEKGTENYENELILSTPRSIVVVWITSERSALIKFSKRNFWPILQEQAREAKMMFRTK